MAIQFNKDLYIPDTLKSIFQEMEISPVGLLKNYALNLIYSKIHRYEAESMSLEKKHRCTFEKFKRKVEGMKNKENFEWEDDLLDWEFAVENLKYWREKSQKIQNE